MALQDTHNLLREDQITAVTASIATTPLGCAAIMPFNGFISNVQGVVHGAFTTNCSVAIAIITRAAGGTAPGAGTAVTGSPLVINATNSALGTTASMAPSGANYAFQGDLITFTPSGSTGTNIGGNFVATIQRG